MITLVRDSKELQQTLHNVNDYFWCCTLLNIIRAQRDFLTAEMRAEVRIVFSVNRAQQLQAVARSVAIELDGQKIVVTILFGLYM